MSEWTPHVDCIFSIITDIYIFVLFLCNIFNWRKMSLGTDKHRCDVLIELVIDHSFKDRMDVQVDWMYVCPKGTRKRTIRYRRREQIMEEKINWTLSSILCWWLLLPLRDREWHMLMFEHPPPVSIIHCRHLYFSSMNDFHSLMRRQFSPVRLQERTASVNWEVIVWRTLKQRTMSK